MAKGVHANKCICCGQGGGRRASPASRFHPITPTPSSPPPSHPIIFTLRPPSHYPYPTTLIPSPLSHSPPSPSLHPQTITSTPSPASHHLIPSLNFPLHPTTLIPSAPLPPSHRSLYHPIPSRPPYDSLPLSSSHHHHHILHHSHPITPKPSSLSHQPQTHSHTIPTQSSLHSPPSPSHRSHPHPTTLIPSLPSPSPPPPSPVSVPHPHHSQLSTPSPPYPPHLPRGARPIPGSPSVPAAESRYGQHRTAATALGVGTAMAETLDLGFARRLGVEEGGPGFLRQAEI